jgi:hypothetical protein
MFKLRPKGSVFARKREEFSHIFRLVGYLSNGERVMFRGTLLANKFSARLELWWTSIALWVGVPRPACPLA